MYSKRCRLLIVWSITFTTSTNVRVLRGSQFIFPRSSSRKTSPYQHIFDTSTIHYRPVFIIFFLSNNYFIFHTSIHRSFSSKQIISTSAAFLHGSLIVKASGFILTHERVPDAIQFHMKNTIIFIGQWTRKNSQATIIQYPSMTRECLIHAGLHMCAYKITQAVPCNTSAI